MRHSGMVARSASRSANPAFGLQAEIPGDAWRPQIRVNQEDRLIYVHRDRNGEIDGQRRLAFALSNAGNCQRRHTVLAQTPQDLCPQ